MAGTESVDSVTVEEPQAAVTRTCKKHGIPIMYERFDNNNVENHFLQGFYYCPKCEHELFVKEQKQAAKERHERLMRGVPHSYQSADLGQFDAKLIAPVIKWADNPRGFLCVTGSCGVGKTHLACAVQKRLNAAGAKGQLVFAAEMFLELRKSFGDKATVKEDAVLAKYAPDAPGAEPMIFDDVGAQKASEYTVDAWYKIIDRFNRHGNPVMVTTNLTPDEMVAMLGERTASRIMSGGVVEIVGEDRRVKKHWTEKYD